MRRRWWLTLIAAPMVVAACSTDEASPGRSGPALTLPPATTTAETTTTAESASPTTTAVGTTTTPPESAPPTNPPPSGEPVDGPIPLLVGGPSGGWLLLGTWESAAWQPAFVDEVTPIAPTIPAGSTLAITGLQAGATSGVTGANVDACHDGRVGPTLSPAVAAPDPPGFGYSAVALPAIWPLQPRPVAVVDASVPAYQAAGEAAFAAAPVDPTLGAVEQIVVADLDGDGDEEALVVFEHVDPAGIVGTPGDFSGLLLIDTATGASATVDSASVGPIAEGEIPIIDQFRVLDVADLNGDGRMEVLVHSWYYEGNGVYAYEYDGTALTQVLSTGCGS